MADLIIYETETGGVAMVRPCDDALSINEIAAATVPDGMPWQVIDDAAIPADQSRRNEWTYSAGGIVLPVGPAPVVVPQVVSAFQARAALMAANLLDAAEAVVAQASPLAQLAWKEAQEFRRSSPLILSMAPAIGLDESELDALFVAAAQIKV